MNSTAGVFEDLIINVSKGSFTAKVRENIVTAVTDAGGCCVENFTKRVKQNALPPSITGHL